MPHNIIELFESWQGKFGKHRNIDFWRLVPNCLMCVFGVKGMLDVLRDVNGLC